MKKALTIFLFLAFFNSYAIDHYLLGGGPAGMGNASVFRTDLWSASHNQAGLAFVENPSFGFFYENRFIVNELALQGGALALPYGNNTFGLTYYYFGYKKYNESTVGLAYSRSFGEKLSFGLQFNYYNTYLSPEYGNKGNVLFEAGVMSKPNDKLVIAAHVYNPTMATIEVWNDEVIPTVFRFGIGYFINSKVQGGVEVYKELGYDTRIKIGFDAQMSDAFFVRAGVATNDLQYHLGLGYKVGRFQVDFAFSTHRELGLTPHMSVLYNIK